jgi:phage internal scaffolding protein
VKQELPFLRTPYNYDRNKASDESGLRCDDESKTIQSQAEDTDINVIMKKYASTGMFPQVQMPPTYGDFEGIEDYQTALHVVMDAQKAFAALPADVRRRFDYDPGEFVAFAEDPKNLPEMEKMGLARPKPEALGAENKGGPGTAPKAQEEKK